jgi:hypothetical protein
MRSERARERYAGDCALGIVQSSAVDTPGHEGVGGAVKEEWMRFVTFVVVLAWALSGCSSEEGVERQVPEATQAPAASPAPEVKSVAEASAPVEPAREVPEGLAAVVLGFPAAQARHIEPGAILDVFATKRGRREGSSGARIGGVLAARDLEVAANVCGPEACSVKVFLRDARALVVLTAREDVTLHPWVRADGARGDDRSARGTLRDALMELEELQRRFDGFVERGREGEHLVRLSLEIGLDARAIGLIAEGTTGELLATFELDQDAPTVGPPEAADFVTIPLFQGVRVEGIRVEGERVAIEVELPMEHAKLVTLAAERAARFDFVERSVGGRHDIYKMTGREALEDVAVITSAPRPVRIKKRRPKKGEPAIEITRER